MRHRPARYPDEYKPERHGEFSFARQMRKQKKDGQGAERAGNEMQDNGPHRVWFDDVMPP
jgi:hypothetical protein